MPDTIPIGELRWPVTIYRRDQVPDGSVGITDTLVPLTTRRAKIEASRPGTFYGSEQVETPVTHFIWMRWVDYLATNCVIARTTLLPDGTARDELFRVRRVKELAGRKRFVEVEAELEKMDLATPPGGVLDFSIPGNPLIVED